MPEREYTPDQIEFLRRFKGILTDMKRTDLDLYQKDLVNEAHHVMAQDCIDAGLVEEMCILRDHQLTTYAKRRKT